MAVFGIEGSLSDHYGLEHAPAPTSIWCCITASVLIYTVVKPDPMKEMYPPADHPAARVAPQSVGYDWAAKMKDDQTNRYLNACIALIGVVGFLVSLYILNHQFTDRDHTFVQGNGLCQSAMAKAGIVYCENKQAPRLRVAGYGDAGIPVAFAIEGVSDCPLRVCFGDGERQVLEGTALFHRYHRPGFFRPELQEFRKGAWVSLSSGAIQVNGFRDAGLLGYSKYD